MTSKEDLKDLKDAFLTIKQEWLEDSNVKLTEWQEKTFDNAIKDLGILEEIRKTFKVQKEETINQNYYWLYIGNRVYVITRKIYDLVKDWLEGNKNDK